MSSLSFQQPSGCIADANEIEYISALHQTSSQIRQDGTITPEDVARYLISRHGIKITPNDVAETIFRNGLSLSSLTTASSSTLASARPPPQEKKKNDESTLYLDLAEITAILFIPELIKMQAEEKDVDDEEEAVGDTSDKIFRDVLNKVLIESGACSSVAGDGDGVEGPPRLDSDLLKRILVAHGETDLANNDELVDSMIQLACAGGETSSESM